MRFFQRSDNLLEIHDKKTEIALPLASIGVALILSGIVIFLHEEMTQKILGMLVSVGGLITLILAFSQAAAYKYYRLKLPEEQLWQRNLFGTKEEMIDPGKVDKIQVKQEPEKTEECEGAYKVSLIFTSGKTIDILTGADEEDAIATADIVAFILDKEVVVESFEYSDRVLGMERFQLPLHKKMRKKYPQGVPRREPPPIDFLMYEQTRYRDFYKMIYPKPSFVYLILLYVFLISIVFLIVVIAFNPEYLAYGLGFFVLGLAAFLIVRAIEKGSFEDISINPEEFQFHRHNPSEEIEVKVPIEDVKSIRIIPGSGYHLYNLKMPSEKDNLKVQNGDRELYVLTENGVIGINSDLNQEAADYLKFKLSESIYTMSQKKKNED